MTKNRPAVKNMFCIMTCIGKDHRGSVAIIVALSLLMLLGFGALAVDLGYVMLVKNELQNAADAGALAGAGNLYDPNNGNVNPGANQTAYDTATANTSQKETVFLDDPNGNDVQRGHWSFATGTFSPNPSTAPVDLWNSSTAELDANTDFINAVRVRTRTQSTVASFLSRIWGGAPSFARTDAVAYIGFAGSLQPEDVDQPIAICKQSILDQSGEYTCNTGRMINSGGNPLTANTGGWTNFTQPCQTASTPSIRPLVCGSGNPLPIQLGSGIGATGGEVANIHEDLRQCFGPKTRTQPWNMTLPVIDCPGNNVSNCATVVGAVSLDIVWISDKGDFAKDDFPPSQMGTWRCSTPADRAACWNSFVTHFNLKNVEGATATYAKKSIYFLPNCTPHIPAGNTGGENFGILARIPVLVK